MAANTTVVKLWQPDWCVLGQVGLWLLWTKSIPTNNVLVTSHLILLLSDPAP
jgi:hypothetical protein